MRYLITPEIHEKIKSVYHTDSGNGQVRTLASGLDLPRWKVTRYAVEQGWTAKQKKEPDWNKKELSILRKNAHFSLGRIQFKLKVRGFHRTIFGIQLKRKRMRMLRNIDGDSAMGLAECLGVDAHFITRAINGGRLRAVRRQTARKPAQGGDIWFIEDRWARKYILENIYEIDIRKVDKYWFVDLLLKRGRDRGNDPPGERG